MSNSAGLERRYRRLLACYPRAFRHEYEQEILSVLMAGADEHQQRLRPGETVDPLTSAIWMRLRPRVSRSQPTVFWAVTLMYVCAALKLLGVPTLPAPPGSSPQPIDIGTIVLWLIEFSALVLISNKQSSPTDRQTPAQP
jgi:hypothetical protein